MRLGCKRLIAVATPISFLLTVLDRSITTKCLRQSPQADGMSDPYGTRVPATATGYLCFSSRTRQIIAFLRAIQLLMSQQTITTSLAQSTARFPGWTRHEQIELDRQEYDICVAARGGKYIGVWVCRDCGVHGASTYKHPTVGQASTRAKIDLCAHHNLVHRRLRKPR